MRIELLYFLLLNWSLKKTRILKLEFKKKMEGMQRSGNVNKEITHMTFPNLNNE